MSTKLKEYVDIARELLDLDQDRDRMFKQIDNVFQMKWAPPSEIAALPWVYPVVSSDGHDALRAVTRVFAARQPSVSVWPGSRDPRDMDKADDLEKALRWFLYRALGTGNGSALADITMSAARYDEVTGQVMYFPYQKSILEGESKMIEDKRRKSQIERKIKAMEDSGPFSFVVRNPRFVHSFYSEHGLEVVGFFSVWKKQKLFDFYGNSAKALMVADKKEESSPYYGVFHFNDYVRRYDFALPLEHEDIEIDSMTLGKSEDDVIELVDQDNDLGWIPWVCERGGTNIEIEEANKRIPMLYSVIRSDQYNINNIIHTIMLSETIAHGAAARGKKSGPGAENIESDYGDPQQDIILRPGQDYERLEPPQLDQALFTLSEWVTSRVEKSTVPRVLQGGDVPSQVYSTLNLAVQSGMITVDPYKKLGERWVSKACLHMLKWCKHYGKKVEAFSFGRDAEQNKTVEVYSLDPAELPKKDVHIEIEFRAEVPVDKVSQLNGAQLYRQLGASKRAALEEVGETDATGLIEEANFEAMEDFFFQRFLKKIADQDQMQVEGQAAQMQLQMQMQAQQMQMQMQQQQQQGGGGGAQRESQPGRRPLPRNPETPPGAANENISGQGYDPNMGGTPPEQAEPGMSQESQTGQTRSGEDAF